MTEHEFTPASTHHGVCATCNLPRDKHDAQQEDFARDRRLVDLIISIKEINTGMCALFAKMDLIARAVAMILAGLVGKPLDAAKVEALVKDLGYEKPSDLLIPAAR